MDQEACEEAIYACDFPAFLLTVAFVAIDGIENRKIGIKKKMRKKAVDQFIGKYISVKIPIRNL